MTSFYQIKGTCNLRSRQWSLAQLNCIYNIQDFSTIVKHGCRQTSSNNVLISTAKVFFFKHWDNTDCYSQTAFTCNLTLTPNHKLLPSVVSFTVHWTKTSRPYIKQYLPRTCFLARETSWLWFECIDKLVPITVINRIKESYSF